MSLLSFSKQINKYYFSCTCTKITPETDQLALFVLHLPDPPVTTVGGGAELKTETTCRLDPHGLLQFHVASRNKVIEESAEDDVQVRIGFVLIYHFD